MSQTSTSPSSSSSTSKASTASNDVPEIIPITLSSASSTSACPRVNGVAQAVAKEIEPDNGNNDRQ